MAAKLSRKELIARASRERCDFGPTAGAYYRVSGPKNQKALLVCADHIGEAVTTLGFPATVEEF